MESKKVLVVKAAVIRGVPVPSLLVAVRRAAALGLAVQVRVAVTVPGLALREPGAAEPIRSLTD